MVNQTQLYIIAQRCSKISSENIFEEMLPLSTCSHGGSHPCPEVDGYCHCRNRRGGWRLPCCCCHVRLRRMQSPPMRPWSSLSRPLGSIHPPADRDTGARIRPFPPRPERRNRQREGEGSGHVWGGRGEHGASRRRRISEGGARAACC
jgi:hypothetical protein